MRLAAQAATFWVFALAVAGKLVTARARESFQAAVHRVVPSRLAGQVASLVLASEAAVVVLVIAPSPLATVGLASAAALFLGFIAASVRLRNDGSSSSCACLGVLGGSTNWRFHMVWDLGFVVICVLGVSNLLPVRTAGDAVASVGLGCLYALLGVIGDAVRFGQERF